MCGINGFNWKSEKLVKQMNSILQHRGPDDKGTYVDTNISLGHTRLSIIDLTKKGKQPMNKLNYTIVFNGEIYNYKELKKELKEYKFGSESDTEVIIYAYDKWGAACLDKFNGMFAFCIYNHKKKELFLARDRFGIKPLYYINKEGKFIFSSEIKALSDFLEKKEIDKQALTQFFNFRFTLGEKTLIKDIKKFLPGHYMFYDLKKKIVEKYVRFYTIKKQVVENKNFSYYKNKLDLLMKKSVERRMVSDVPVACLLSGGIDSSIITALAKKHNKQLNTFSMGFDTTNELSYAKRVAKHLKTNHYEFKINKDNVLSFLDDMIYHMDEPIGDPGFLPIFVLSKEVSKYNKVVLSGDGGDEVFCGYDRYKLFHHGLKLRNLAFFNSRNDILKRLNHMRGKNDYEAFVEIIRLFDAKELKLLGIPKYDASSTWKNKYKTSLTNAQEFDINTLLPDDFFMKADKMSSAFGLEQRVPFLDHELVEFAFSIPLKYKLKGWNEKHILKETFRKNLPKEIVERRKHGFDVPIDYWFKNVLGRKLRELLERNNHNLYKKEYVYALLDKIKKSGNNYKLNFILAQKLWSILVFEMWYDTLIKKGLSKPLKEAKKKKMFLKIVKKQKNKEKNKKNKRKENIFVRFVKEHNKKAHKTRIKRLSGSIAKLISKDEKRILDVGAFYGLLAHKISQIKKKSIIGVDISVPDKTFIPVKVYDGKKLPFANNSFDCVLLIDVLHHNPKVYSLLREAKRVASKSIIIKDHTYNGILDKSILSLVDYLGNKSYGIRTPLKFYKIKEWKKIFKTAGLKLVYQNYDYKQKKKDIIKHILVKLEK